MDIPHEVLWTEIEVEVVIEVEIVIGIEVEFALASRLEARSRLKKNTNKGITRKINDDVALGGLTHGLDR